MSAVGQIVVLVGAAISLLAGVGLLRFNTTSSRLHAAGKASPVAFVVTALGAGLTIGWAGATDLAIASAAMVFTLPLGVHLLLRAVVRANEEASQG